MHGFWVASLQVWPRWALTVIRFVEKYFTCVKDPKNSGQSLVAALQSRPPLTLTINTIRDYVSMYMQLFTPLYVTSHHYDICTFVGSYLGIIFWRGRTDGITRARTTIRLKMQTCSSTAVSIRRPWRCTVGSIYRPRYSENTNAFLIYNRISTTL